MIREATELDCINLTALSLEVWFQTYQGNGIGQYDFKLGKDVIENRVMVYDAQNDEMRGL